MEDEEALDLLRKQGAASKGKRVLLPNALVEESLQKSQGRVALRGRGGAIVLGEGELHVHNLGGARSVLDLRNGEIRSANRQDVAVSTRILDALKSVSSITPLYTPVEVPGEIMTGIMFYETARHTLKPIHGPGVQNRAEVQLLAEMARIVFEDPKAMSCSLSPISPLEIPYDASQAILEIARQGFPFGPLPCPQMGITAPMSLAGALTQQNAEVLACLTLAQCAHPGLPILYCGRLASVDMRSATPSWGSPEIGLLAAAAVQLGHSYGLPVNVYGLACGGYPPDIRSGIERTLNALLPALAGADELSGVGELAGGVCSSNAQLVIDDEIMGRVKWARDGFTVNEEKLALEVIQGVIESSERTFLTEAHTIENLRSGEPWIPRFPPQEDYSQDWTPDRFLEFVMEAQQRAEKLLAEHEVPDLSRDQLKALDELLRRKAQVA